MAGAKSHNAEARVDDLIRAVQLEPICGGRQLLEARTALVSLMRGETVVAWAREDDLEEIISAKQKTAGEAAGGVAAQAVAPFSVALVRRLV